MCGGSITWALASLLRTYQKHAELPLISVPLAPCSFISVFTVHREVCTYVSAIPKGQCFADELWLCLIIARILGAQYMETFAELSLVLVPLAPCSFISVFTVHRAVCTYISAILKGQCLQMNFDFVWSLLEHWVLMQYIKNFGRRISVSIAAVIHNIDWLIDKWWIKLMVFQNKLWQ